MPLPIYYEYDAQGWLVGWHQDSLRPLSTLIPFAPIPPAQARWNGTAWTTDPTQTTARATADTNTQTARTQALQLLRNFNPAVATATDVTNALAALITVLRLPPS